MKRLLGNSWRSGWLSAMLVLGFACGLLVAPMRVDRAVRVFVRDAVAPGAQALALARKWTAQTSAGGWRALVRRIAAEPTDGEPAAALVRERDEALAAQRRLEAQVALLADHLRRAEETASRLLAVTPGTPLVRAKGIRARVIGQDRRETLALADRLIDAGASEGVGVDDLVVQVSFESASEPKQPFIDQGRHAGIEPDSPVAAGGLLVGRIREVGAWTSSVQLAREEGFRVGARLVRDGERGPVFGAGGVFAGGGAGACRMELVSSQEPVAVGDRVYTHQPVAGVIVPLLIGTVAAAEVPAGEAHWRIEVRPALEAIPAMMDVLSIELNPDRAIPATATEEPS